MAIRIQNEGIYIGITELKKECNIYRKRNNKNKKSLIKSTLKMTKMGTLENNVLGVSHRIDIHDEVCTISRINRLHLM